MEVHCDENLAIQTKDALMSSVSRSASAASVTETDISSAPSLEHRIKADIIFRSAKDTFDVLEEIPGDGLIVGGVSEKALESLDYERDVRKRKVRFVFIEEQQILFISIPTEAHEQMHHGINSSLTLLLGAMGLDEEHWVSTGASRYPNSSTGSRGEGDGGGYPWKERSGKDEWPTIVFESGFSQSLPSLRQKMQFWFARSNHQVQVVVLLKAFPEALNKRILIEVWEERTQQLARPGATTTRRSGGLLPLPVQTINVVWALQTIEYANATTAQRLHGNNFNVTRGPLTLSFRKLFLRPAASPREHDIIFPDSKLQIMAAKVWGRA